jgi:hypothetical protein
VFEATADHAVAAGAIKLRSLLAGIGHLQRLCFRLGFSERCH